jgi:hypothetical protein
VACFIVSLLFFVKYLYRYVDLIQIWHNINGKESVYWRILVGTHSVFKAAIVVSLCLFQSMMVVEIKEFLFAVDDFETAVIVPLLSCNNIVGLALTELFRNDATLWSCGINDGCCRYCWNQVLNHFA